MGIFRVPLIVAATKRRGGADINLSTVAALGGDSAVGALYCFDKNGALHESVSHSGGFLTAVRDYRGAAGYGPVLNQLGSGGGPAIDVANRILTNDTSATRAIGSALSAVFALNGVARSLILIGAGKTGGLYWSYLAAIAEGAALTRSMGVRSNNSTAYEAFHNGTAFGVGYGPATGTTRRLLILSQDGTVAGHRHAPTLARDNFVITAASAGTAQLTLGALFVASTDSAIDGHLRAAMFLNRVPTAGDLTILQEWAVSHGATLY